MKKAAFIGLGILIGFATSGQAWLEENTRSISMRSMNWTTLQ